MLLAGRGVAGAMLQVVWTCSMIVFHGSYVRAFSTCLATYLAGLALRGGLVGLLPTRWAANNRALSAPFWDWVRVDCAPAMSAVVANMTWVVPGSLFWTVMLTSAPFQVTVECDRPLIFGASAFSVVNWFMPLSAEPPEFFA